MHIPYMDIFVVGCGGIGGYVLNLLPQTMACLLVDDMTETSPERARAVLRAEGIDENISVYNRFHRLVLIDGDSFSGHNALRQNGIAGSKLAVQMAKLRAQDAMTTWLASTRLQGYNTYVTPKNIEKIFSTDSASVKCVFLCVDNHKTRYEITQYLEAQRNQHILLINGGNKKTSGNVTVFENAYGQLKDPPIYKLYPEVNDKHDLRPDEVDCGSVTAENDQTAITNNMIASIMLAVFTKWVRNGSDGLNQKLSKRGADGSNLIVRKNEWVVDFETMTMMSLAHSPTVDNRELSILVEQ